MHRNNPNILKLENADPDRLTEWSFNHTHQKVEKNQYNFFTNENEVSFDKFYNHIAIED